MAVPKHREEEEAPSENSRVFKGFSTVLFVVAVIALVDAPDIERSPINFKRLSLTDINIDIKRVILNFKRLSILIKAMEAAVILARFGIPQVVVTDNGTQFTNKKFQEFLITIGTTQHFTSVEHPQTNGQAEAANRVLLRGLRRRMGTSKGNWTEELHSVLWSYRTTPHSTTGETPFRLTYGTEAVIPVEIGEPSSRIEYPPEEDINDELLREELDLVEELRTGASLREATLKQKIAARHDKRVIKREFEVGSLVLRRNQKDTREGKLAANWEGPYRVRAKTENGAYHLEDLYDKEIPPLNANVHARRGNTPCEPHRRLVQARQSTQLAMGCSMPRGKISKEEAFLDSSLGASQMLVQFHKLLGNGAYDPRHQEATVIVRRALA
ncbi:hypothetical protein TSUD_384420 [Trifolium subterraneum]|uniref:Integrase catalytic domain-containing protein n=1 Tax=Trifolium subterraneum TaxID=3900 RepID=A0A2Z6NZ98_TRISU|nr:hypothetical protein TSUD_384420 [Trifolium subterraneum]